MPVRRLIMWVGLFGLTAVVLLILGLKTPGRLLAFIQLTALVGAPLASLLDKQLRSRPVMFVVGVALSISLSSLAAQSLIWFDLAGPALLVAVATGYGMALTWLLAAAGFDSDREAAEATTGGKA